MFESLAKQKILSIQGPVSDLSHALSETRKETHLSAYPETDPCLNASPTDQSSGSSPIPSRIKNNPGLQGPNYGVHYGPQTT